MNILQLLPTFDRVTERFDKLNNTDLFIQCNSYVRLGYSFNDIVLIQLSPFPGGIHI